MARRICGSVKIKISLFSNHLHSQTLNVHLNFLQKHFQFFEMCASKRLRVCKVNRVVLLTIWTNVFVNEVRFTLQDSNALSMEPILAFVATNVEPERSEQENVDKDLNGHFFTYCA